MMRSQQTGNRYLAGLVIVFAVIFFLIGTLGPARRSLYYPLIVPLPAFIVIILGWQAWSSRERSASYSAAGLMLLLAVLAFSHLLPRSTG
jgi:hypothetical protein